MFKLYLHLSSIGEGALLKWLFLFFNYSRANSMTNWAQILTCLLLYTHVNIICRDTQSEITDYSYQTSPVPLNEAFSKVVIFQAIKIIRLSKIDVLSFQIILTLISYTFIFLPLLCLLMDYSPLVCVEVWCQMFRLIVCQFRPSFDNNRWIPLKAPDTFDIAKTSILTYSVSQHIIICRK